MTVKRSLVLIALYAVLVFGIGFGLGPLLLPKGTKLFEPTPALFLLVALFAAIGAIGVVWYGSVKLPRRSWRELGWHTGGLGGHIVRGVLGAILGLAIVFAIRMSQGEAFEDTWARFTRPGLADRMAYLCIGVQAAFIEESLFRGNLLPALRRRMSWPAALLVNGLLFAVYHLNNLRLHPLIARTLLGVMYGALRGRDGSLVAPTIAHAGLWVLSGTM